MAEGNMPNVFEILFRNLLLRGNPGARQLAESTGATRVPAQGPVTAEGEAPTAPGVDTAAVMQAISPQQEIESPSRLERVLFSALPLAQAFAVSQFFPRRQRTKAFLSSAVSGGAQSALQQIFTEPRQRRRAEAQSKQNQITTALQRLILLTQAGRQQRPTILGPGQVAVGPGGEEVARGIDLPAVAPEQITDEQGRVFNIDPATGQPSSQVRLPEENVSGAQRIPEVPSLFGFQPDLVPGGTPSTREFRAPAPSPSFTNVPAGGTLFQTGPGGARQVGLGQLLPEKRDKTAEARARKEEEQNNLRVALPRWLEEAGFSPTGSPEQKLAAAKRAEANIRRSGKTPKQKRLLLDALFIQFPQLKQGRGRTSSRDKARALGAGRQ